MDIKNSWETEGWLESVKRILQWSATVDPSKPMMFILRHSHRETLRDHEHMASAGLTDMGKQMSFEVGRRIPLGRSMELYTSFVPRAYETAEEIAKGYTEIGGEAAEVELLPTLVSPHILNPDIWLRLHPDGQNITDYVNSWIKGEFEGYIEPYKDYKTKFMEDTVGRLVAAERSVIYIGTTHDFTLMSAKRMFLGRDLDYDDREPFLGGLGLTLADSEVEVFIGSTNRAFSIRR
ncbi:MAG: hypothetical protein RTV41_07945 [Candidatus Thorarchaeota archaeon]